jgi:copper chaperone CopZ
MKRFLFILLSSGILVSLLIIKTSFFPESWLIDYETTVIELRTIVCGNCTETVKKALSNDPGIISTNVSLESKTVFVRYNRTKTSLEKIEDYIVNSGYDANDKAADSNAYKVLSECCQIWGNGEDYHKPKENKSHGCKGGCCSN